jgi:hypothetical protein
MDPLNDPRFPQRPQHPDFWAIVDAVNHLDARATEDKQPLPQILNELVDVDEESLTYIATMRAIKAVELLHLPSRFESALASTFINAFSTGVLFQRNRRKPVINTYEGMAKAIEQMQVDHAVEMLNHPAFVVVQYQGKGSAEEPAVYGPYTAQAEALADRDRRHQFALDNWASDILSTYGGPVTLVAPLWRTDED